MNTENKPNPANNTPEFFIKQRKAKKRAVEKINRPDTKEQIEKRD